MELGCNLFKNKPQMLLVSFFFGRLVVSYQKRKKSLQFGVALLDGQCRSLFLFPNIFTGTVCMSCGRVKGLM
uniref:Uncharacterized protein n=1 Tax=Arundo donax TaxID=35708 RepID=A0A0A9FV78_ARUDO